MQDSNTIPDTAAALLAAVLCAQGCFAQLATPSAVRMSRLSELAPARANASSLLPPHARDAQFSDKQAVTIDGVPRVTVLPVRFKVPLQNVTVEGQWVTQCGVVVTLQGSAPRLLVTLGTGNTEMMTCTGIKAVGGAPAADARDRPDLIMIFNAYTGRESLPATILLTWDAQRMSYAVDDASSQWLGEQKDGRTVAGARRLLATKRLN